MRGLCHWERKRLKAQLYGRTKHPTPLHQRSALISCLCYHHCRYSLKLFHSCTNQHPPFGSTRPCSIPSWFYSEEVAPRIRLYQRWDWLTFFSTAPQPYPPVSTPGSIFWIHQNYEYISNHPYQDCHHLGTYFFFRSTRDQTIHHQTGRGSPGLRIQKPLSSRENLWRTHQRKNQIWAPCNPILCNLIRQGEPYPHHPHNRVIQNREIRWCALHCQGV